MKALIRKCSDDSYWYRDMVGEYLDVLSSEEHIRGGLYAIVRVDRPDNDDRNTAGIMPEDCLVFLDKDVDKVKAAFDKLEKYLQKLSL